MKSICTINAATTENMECSIVKTHIPTIDLKVDLSLNRGTSLCFISIPVLWILDTIIFQAENNIICLFCVLSCNYIYRAQLKNSLCDWCCFSLYKYWIKETICSHGYFRIFHNATLCINTSCPTPNFFSVEYIALTLCTVNCMQRKIKVSS